MKKHLLLSVLLLALGGVIYCAALADWAFCLSFVIALVLSVIEIIELHSKDGGQRKAQTQTQPQDSKEAKK